MFFVFFIIIIIIIIVFNCFLAMSWFTSGGAGVLLLLFVLLGFFVVVGLFFWGGLNPQKKKVMLRKEGNVLFNDTLNTFYLWLYGIRHMVKDHSDIEKGNPLLPHRLLFPINSKGSFICTIPQTG